MELFAGAPLLLSLAVLALVDSLSVGTLLIPVFLLLNPGKVRVSRVLLYLVTIAAFYLAVGLLFLWGLVNVVDVASDFLTSPAGTIIRLIVGVGLLVASFLIPSSSKKKAQQPVAAASASSLEGFAHPDAAPSSPQTPAQAQRPGRIVRWRDRLLDPRTTRAALMSVAVAAGVVEVATMLPYIVAMTMLADAGLDTPARVVSLVGYCLVMIVPALVLLILRIVAAPVITRPLQRLADWMQRTGAENTAWIIGILGFLIARAAAVELGLF
ncbi:GAP family protein [Microbacterium sp.]|uniref:GAP family protein n=1 Tax=Microbacterium sp. TaxID=51671 RepID=UPI0027363CE3|nr:GAP family protein [Microbacterium sp.]MDP3952544.1 GAP family protein [Microbacterium sp.]